MLCNYESQIPFLFFPFSFFFFFTFHYNKFNILINNGFFWTVGKRDLICYATMRVKFLFSFSFFFFLTFHYNKFNILINNGFFWTVGKSLILKSVINSKGKEGKMNYFWTYKDHGRARTIPWWSKPFHLESRGAALIVILFLLFIFCYKIVTIVWCLICSFSKAWCAWDNSGVWEYSCRMVLEICEKLQINSVSLMFL